MHEPDDPRRGTADSGERAGRNAQITVAVASCGRPVALGRCLEALAHGTSVPTQVIVVDQAPTEEARRIAEDCGLTNVLYLAQPRLGLSASRNLALAASSSSWFAVTDDDCAPDRSWIEAIGNAIERHPEPGAVTGRILPLGPPRPGTFVVSLRESPDERDYVGVVLPWLVGSGANFAASAALLRRLGGWDEQLGVGSRGQAAEDADLQYRLLREGAIVRYDPAVVVRHERQSRERFLASGRSYGFGIGALSGSWLRRGDRFAGRMICVRGAFHARRLVSAARVRDRGSAEEHLRSSVGLAAGFVHGLRTVPSDFHPLSVPGSPG